jgi:hypothetical protein
VNDYIRKLPISICFGFPMLDRVDLFLVAVVDQHCQASAKLLSDRAHKSLRGGC